MKKNQKTITAKILGLFLLGLLPLLLSSCKNTADNTASGFKQITLNDVQDVFIINPTEEKKYPNNNWFTINTGNSERSASETRQDENNLISEFKEHTVTFSSKDIPPLKSNFARATENNDKYTMKYKKDDTHTFYCNMEEKTELQLSTILRHEGEYCYIWTPDEKFHHYDEDSVMTEAEIKAFAEKFDLIYQKETALCGPKYDGNTVLTGIILPDEKISIVLYDFGNNKSQGNYYGYFTTASYYGGNAMEVVFVDSYYAKNESTKGSLYSAVAHEFNHLLNFVNKTLKYGKSMKSWYTEMLSMITEDFLMEELNTEYKYSPQKRLELFIMAGHKYGFGNWTQTYHDIESYNYANAYAFGAFLARNYGGAELIHEIATNEYVDEESVVKAVNKINESAYSFNDLIKNFVMILINPLNTNPELPSLYKSYSKNGYSLSKINLNGLGENIKIQPDYIDEAPAGNLDSYGFLYFHFDEKKDVRLELKDFLIVNNY